MNTVIKIHKVRYSAHRNHFNVPMIFRFPIYYAIELIPMCTELVMTIRETAVVPELVMTICLVFYFNGAHTTKESYEDIKSTPDKPAIKNALKQQLVGMQREYDGLLQKFVFTDRRSRNGF